VIYIAAIVVAFCWHFLLEKMWPATIGSTITSTLLIWALTSSHFGWLDETFYKNMAMTLAVSFVASFIIGIIFTSIRKNSEKAKT
jgi:uncharacterized membrane-anchored protein YitT (DUF2179 family)